MRSRRIVRAVVASSIVALVIVAYAACGLNVVGLGPPTAGDAGSGDAVALDADDPDSTVGEQECTAGRATCEGVCTDTTTDPAHCGACGSACNSGDTCSDGGCGPLCLSETVVCGGECVSTKTDPRHCSACAKACADPTPLCLDSVCVPDCGDAGAAVCPGVGSAPAYCAYTMTDPKNCGTCGTICKSNEVCKAGACTALCATGYAVGDVFPNDMVGCAGKVDFDERNKLCPAGTHVCSPQEWVDKRGGVAPKFSYWTSQDLGVEGKDTDCSVDKPGKKYKSCNNPMRVCSNYTDPLGNRCNLKECGLEKRKPHQYFGGCKDNKTAGALCCK